MSKQRIAIYTHSVAPSIDGVCRRFAGILWELARQGHDVLLFTLEDQPLDLPPTVQYVTLEHMIFPSYPDKKVARPSLVAMKRIMEHINKFKPSTLHITSDGFSHMFTFAGLVYNVPVLGSFHTDLLDLLKSHNANLFQKLCVQSKECLDSLILDSCATTSTSFAAKLKLQGIYCEHVIKTAVDIDTFTAGKKNTKLRNEMMFGDKNGFLCVYVGRISKEKRIDVIVDAVKSLDGVYLAVVGDGPSAAVYAGLHGKHNRIYCKPKFLSHSELAEVYASSDLHVTASEFETLGNTVLEAFACSIPVVVPNTQGFKDTVSDKNDGFLFQPANSDDAKRFILQLKNDVNLRKEMGSRGRAKVALCTIGNVVLDLLDWYKKGSKNRVYRTFISKVGAVLLCIFTIPFTMIALTCYDIINMILIALGIFPTQKNEKKD